MTNKYENTYFKKIDWQTRAIAAEKTTWILTEKIKGFYNGTEKTAIGKQVEKASRREEQNRRKRELLEAQQAELQKYSKKLEVEVAERTRDLRLITDNVTFGFLIIDTDLKVMKEATKSCEELFETKKIVHQDIFTLLQLNSRAKENMKVQIEQVFEDLLPEDVSLSQIQKFHKLNSGKTIQIEGKGIRDENQKLVGILFSISDASNLIKAQKEAELSTALLRIMRNRDSFVNMVFSARNELKLFISKEKNHLSHEARRCLHTLKGNFASFGVADVAEFIHDIEGKDTLSVYDFAQVEAEIIKFLNNNYGLIGLSYNSASTSGEESFHITKSKINDLGHLMSRVNSDEIGRDFKNWLKSVEKRPAQILIGPMDEFVKRLSQRLKKNVQFNVVGGDVLVDPAILNPIFQNVTHLIRNSIDHGIEAPESRGNKKPEGSLSMSICQTKEDEIQIIFEDDGRGIDHEKLLKKAIENGLVKPDEAKNMTQIEKTNLIFLDGLSSSTEVTEISGRGVGMSAVRASVLRAGGTIEVVSLIGKGTRFEIKVPMGAKSQGETLQRKAS